MEFASLEDLAQHFDNLKRRCLRIIKDKDAMPAAKNRAKTEAACYDRTAHYLRNAVVAKPPVKKVRLTAKV